MSSAQRQELAKMWEDLANKEIPVIEGKSLQSLDFKGLDLSGKTLKNCDVSRTDFTNCVGLPIFEDCKINGTKVTSITVVKTQTGAKTIYSMIRGSKPFYMIDDKEIIDLSREREAIDMIRRFLT